MAGRAVTIRTENVPNMGGEACLLSSVELALAAGANRSDQLQQRRCKHVWR